MGNSSKLSLGNIFEPVLAIYLIKLLGWFDFSITLLSYSLLSLLCLSRLREIIILKSRFIIEKKILTYVFFCLYLFTAIIIVNFMVYGVNINPAVKKQYYFFLMCLVLFIYPQSVKKSPCEYYNKIYNTSIFFTIIATIYGIFFLLESVVYDVDLGFTSHLLERGYASFYHIYAGRACGFFMNPGMHSYIVISFVPLLIAFRRYGVISNVKFSIMLFICIFSIAISISKTAIPLFVVYIIYFYLITNDVKNLKILFVIIFSLILLFMFFFAMGHFNLDSIRSIANLRLFVNDPFSAGTTTVRMTTYSDALEIISNNFFAGAGLDTTSKYFGITIHNTFLQMFASIGVFGFIFQVCINFLVPIYIISKLEIKLLKKLAIGYIFIHFVFLMTRDFTHFDALFIYYYILYVLYCFDKDILSSSCNDNIYHISA